MSAILRWESRYSSSEMMYLEVRATDVRCYLNRPANRGDVYSFEQVLAGEMDNEIGAVFGRAILEELKTASRAAAHRTARESSQI